MGAAAEAADEAKADEAKADEAEADALCFAAGREEAALEVALDFANAADLEDKHFVNETYHDHRTTGKNGPNSSSNVADIHI